MKRMDRRWALLGLCALLLTARAGAEGLDTSRPLVCDLAQVSQCDAAARCRDVTFAQIDLPPVFRVDFAAHRVISEDGRRASPITEVEALDADLVVHGQQERRGWTMVIERATGHLSAALADAEGVFAIAGACVAD